MIAAQTISQLSAGIVLNPPEIIGPLAGFTTLAVAARGALVLVVAEPSRLRGARRAPRRPRRRADMRTWIAGLAVVLTASGMGLMYRLGRSYGADPAERTVPLPGDQVVPRPDVFFIPDGSPETECGFTVVHLEPARMMLLDSTTHLPRSGGTGRSRHCIGPGFSCSFRCEGERTRFVARWRGRMEPWWRRVLCHAVIVPADFIMSRDMLRGLRLRAEWTAEHVAPGSADGATYRRGLDGGAAGVRETIRRRTFDSPSHRRAGPY